MLSLVPPLHWLVTYKRLSLNNKCSDANAWPSTSTFAPTFVKLCCHTRAKNFYCSGLLWIVYTIQGYTNLGPSTGVFP